MRRVILSFLAITLLVSCETDTAPDVTVSSTTSSTDTTSTEPSPTPVPTSSTTTAPVPETEVAIYLFFEGYPVEPGPYLAAIARTGVEDLEGAMIALLQGPTASESAMGLSSTIPDGTALRGIEVVNGIAHVDLSREFEGGGGSLSMMGRVAQIVYTATRFEGIGSVRFLLEGRPLDVLGGEGLIIDEPQTREAWAEMIPPIFVEEPLWGSMRGNDLSFEGTAMLDSGTVSYVVVDSDGLIVSEGEVTLPASERGGFAVDVRVDPIPNPGLGSVIAWEWAPDGSQRHVVEYPLNLVEDD